jgi:hypothetical protein
MVNGRAFIWWNYDEGVSGTLSLSPEVAGQLATELECIKLLADMEDTNG